MILQLPRDGDVAPATELNIFHQLCESFRTMPKATIGVIDGIVRGGGCEFASSLDMRFASVENGLFGQPEVALGILPGGSGTQRLPHLIGRGRALEVILGCDDVDATTAAQWGLVNRAMPAAELGSFVDRMAQRIASSPAGAIAEAKASVLRATGDPTPGLLAEGDAFNRTLRDDESSIRMREFLESGGQTREGERNLQETLQYPSRGVASGPT